MPEVFQNHYSFAPGSVPSAEAFHERLASQFGQAFEMEKQELGYHGAPRAFAALRYEKMQIWIFWENDRPDIEMQVDEPMLRMIPINAAVVALGGTPKYGDAWWKARRRGRMAATIIRMIVIACLAALAFATIWFLHWWGLLLVVATVVISACVWTIGLARAFSNR